MPLATSAGTLVLNGAATDALNSTYIASVTAKRRALIAVPAGSGAIRGVATYGGSKYCWRDNAGATAGVMFKATTAGWVAQTFGNYILFTAGTTEFLEAETLTGGTSGATGTIERVILQSGAWDGSGVGYIVLSGVVGAYGAAETITSASGSATSNGVDVAITLPAAGKYRSIEENFYSQEATTRLYVANGVGPAFEWDGSVLAPIFTGLSAALEKPLFVGVQRFHLFLGYLGGSLQNSSTGLPLTFNAVTGAGEIGFGQEITGFKSNHKDSMFVTGRNKVAYLIGTDASSFDLKRLSEDSGAIIDTLEVVGEPIFMDDQGLRSLKAVQAYGDWKMGTVSRMVEPLLKIKRRAGVTPAGVIRVRSKDQLRVYFSDGTGLIVYFGRKDPEIMAMNIGFTPSCLASGEDESGDEILLAGGPDGMVYELDRGTSFDGSSIEAFLRTSFLNQKAPNTEKRFHRARLEGQAGISNSALAMVADFSYGSEDQPPSNETDFTFFGNGGFWDELTWNEFTWSSQLEGQAFAELDGIGENVSVVFMSDSATEAAHTLSSLTINFTPRRKLR